MNIKKNALLGFTAAAVVSLLAVLGIFDRLDNTIYDLFLRFRANRERINNVVFLNVDDAGIAFHGVFPWPRSITADALLRLKEYGALAAIFDIEYIEKGPPGVDSIYLEQGLARDFNRSFSEVSARLSEIFSAYRDGRLSRDSFDERSREMISIIETEQNELYARARAVARDNDTYLAQASALYGRSWATLNLREHPLVNTEEINRRPMAEELFSRQINALPGTNPGDFTDILPALPAFSESAKGAGFTNAVIDPDGVRRRIYLAQNIHDHWYLQLSFAPLMDYLGNPEIELDNRKMTIKNARFPTAGSTASETRDIIIPLDGRSRMMLDWPPENYFDSYQHISFYDFSLLETLEAELEQYSLALLYADIDLFSQFDPSLAVIPFIVMRLEALFEEAKNLRVIALENSDEESFFMFLEYRDESRRSIREILELDAGTAVNDLASQLCGEGGPITDPLIAEYVFSEAEYINNIILNLAHSLFEYDETSLKINNAVRDKFCIIGRVDSGTTDMGQNPFWGSYINVGTHAVVLDTILSESYLVPLGIIWRILLTLLFTPLLIIATASLKPVFRAGLGFGGALFITAAAILVFRFTGFFLAPLEIVLSLAVAVIIREVMAYAVSERDKQFYRKAFATYTSEAVANEIANNPSLLQLGGTKRRMSAIFTDVKGFSTISEQLSPEDLVSLLNRYLTAMSDVVLEEQGTIDKYVGDAIIAFFGAPLEQPDHALRACISAIKMRQAEIELNRIILEENLSPVPLLTRIGINSGDMVAGNMGTDKKMNYTIMGDAVNLAARLEGVNKQYHTWILASDEIINQTENRLLVRRLDRVQVVGKNEPVQLFNVLETMEDATSEQKKIVDLFHKALDYFENRNWKQAEEAFREINLLEKDGPAEVYLKRCVQYIDSPPKDNWNGVFTLTEK